MLIAKEKKQNNISEYILYMWQVEDLVRACHFNIETIKQHIIDPFDTSDEVKKELLVWYENLIETMKIDHLELQGHTRSIQNTLDDLQQLHNKLIQQADQAIYCAAFYRAFPHIQALNAKTNKASGEIELCFNALYGTLLLRMKKVEISSETNTSIQEITTLIKQLTKCYHEVEKGTLVIE